MPRRSQVKVHNATMTVEIDFSSSKAAKQACLMLQVPAARPVLCHSCPDCFALVPSPVDCCVALGGVVMGRGV